MSYLFLAKSVAPCFRAWRRRVNGPWLQEISNPQKGIWIHFFHLQNILVAICKGQILEQKTLKEIVRGLVKGTATDRVKVRLLQKLLLIFQWHWEAYLCLADIWYRVKLAFGWDYCKCLELIFPQSSFLWHWEPMRLQAARNFSPFDTAARTLALAKWGAPFISFFPVFRNVRILVHIVCSRSYH